MLDVFDGKYRRFGALDWGPRRRLRFGYFNPDDHYEALLANQIGSGTRWADIGCGRDIFPSNPELAKTLAERCARVTGIDPDDNVLENTFITDHFHGMVEDFEADAEYDLVSMRMVAEHVARPEDVARKIAQIVRPGGLVVVYTPHKWAPVSVVARWTPMRVHHVVKRWLWNTEEQDTFPVEFKMNTRPELRQVMRDAGLREVYYRLVDDCRVFNNFRVLNFLELSLWKVCRVLRLPYPERCILAVFVREPAPTEGTIV